ncbi:ArsR/SmtB family transcription factor [Streptomyces coeruleorubidus]|jgi:DNA-binding transcriptional ArsR family regulator|uniref:Metalloregulator ArsR/SmtB family transcription factor n=2 Tax=Streptomyces TaxID=1883 RepID=A0A5J6I7L8_STRC4|nr:MULTISPECIES: metalloregulator ArsR/SmtB family transcription factor [Streptomyces]QEV28416.1 transcriptional regulator [Streptomyces coeruleorubidus]WOT33605.1 metalloregulator ArsR/SmtB family transcription factor [Streptomyces coeruleorubidus]GAP48467.1 ArsR family transcriptional regulator [Streptomyces azureus]GGU29997.1 transcriptional regulator [Streptomyces bellus]
MTTTPSPPTDDPDQTLQAASELLRALASPVRLGIVRELSAGGKYVHELVTALGVSQPLVSQHLRVLRTSRIVTARRQARETRYTLTDDHVAHIVLDAIRHAQE